AVIPRAAHPRPSPVTPIPAHDTTRVAIATDREATGTSVVLFYQRPRRGRATVAEFRRDAVEGLAVGMLNARLDERMHAPEAPFVSAGAWTSSLGRTAEQFGLFAALP